MAHTLSGFGMDLTGVAKNPRSLVPFNRMGSLDDLGRLVETADYLINLLPDTPDTHDIYDRALFARLKPTALFINAGRGVAVVDADLVAALENNQLAGAVIDVCREEPLPANHLFWHTPRLLLTGHTAAPTLPGRWSNCSATTSRASGRVPPCAARWTSLAATEPRSLRRRAGAAGSPRR